MEYMKRKLYQKWYKVEKWLKPFMFNTIRLVNKRYQKYQDDIKEIVLHMENLESVTICRADIGEFHLGDFSKRLSRTACNHIGEIETAGSFWIEIHARANKWVENKNYGDGFIFDRINKSKDITSVDVVYRTGKCKSYYVEYKENEIEWGSGANNQNQKTKSNSFGDLCIAVGGSIDIESIFPQDEYDSAALRNYKWRMYSQPLAN